MSKQHLEHVNFLDQTRLTLALHFINRNMMNKARDNNEIFQKYVSELRCYHCNQQIDLGSKTFSKRFPSGPKYYHFECARRVGRI
jgi:hypothetical protein